MHSLTIFNHLVNTFCLLFFPSAFYFAIIVLYLCSFYCYIIQHFLVFFQQAPIQLQVCD